MSAAKHNQPLTIGPSGIEAIRHDLEQAAEFLPRPTWPDHPDPAAFYSVAGDFVRVVETYTEADPVALLAQFIVAFGAAAGRNLHRVVEKTRHHLNIFAVLVGDTSKARKGSSWSWVEDLFKRVDPSFTNSRVLGGMSSGEGLIWAVRDPIEEPHRRGRGENAHIELEVTDLGVADKRLLVLESEFSSALRVAARCENILTEIIRRASDGSHVLQTLTKNSPSKATDAHIAIVGHITADELRERLDRSDVANGFANRFMFLCVKRSKAIAHPIERTDALEVALASIAGRLRDALHFAHSDRQIEFSPEARDAWTTIYPELSEGAPGLLGAILSRAEAQVLRVALVYAALDSTSTIRQRASRGLPGPLGLCRPLNCLYLWRQPGKP
jgi:hypothetical protein